MSINKLWRGILICMLHAVCEISLAILMIAENTHKTFRIACPRSNRKLERLSNHRIWTCRNFLHFLFNRISMWTFFQSALLLWSVLRIELDDDDVVNFYARENGNFGNVLWLITPILRWMLFRTARQKTQRYLS